MSLRQLLSSSRLLIVAASTQRARHKDFYSSLFSKSVISGSGVAIAIMGCNTSSSAAVNAANMEMGENWKGAKSVYEFDYMDIDGKSQSMRKFEGQPLIVVNVASKVNYTQLTELYEKYSDKGLRIIGFPCNQFGGQEPGSETEIKEFIKQFNVTFDMTSKIEVNGDNAHPLWKYMKSKKGGTLGAFIKWNFTKFLIDKQGHVLERFGPTNDPLEMEKDIIKLL